MLSVFKGGGGGSNGSIAECCYLAPVLLPLGRSFGFAGVSLVGRCGKDRKERMDFAFTIFLFASDKPRCERCPSLWFGLAASSGSAWMWFCCRGLEWELENWMLFSALALV